MRKRRDGEGSYSNRCVNCIWSFNICGKSVSMIQKYTFSHELCKDNLRKQLLKKWRTETRWWAFGRKMKEQQEQSIWDHSGVAGKAILRLSFLPLFFETGLLYPCWSGVPKYLRLILNSWSSCLDLLRAGVIGMHRHVQLKDFIFIFFPLDDVHLIETKCSYTVDCCVFFPESVFSNLPLFCLIKQES